MYVLGNGRDWGTIVYIFGTETKNAENLAALPNSCCEYCFIDIDWVWQ